MAISGFVTNQRTRTRNSTLHNQLITERKLIEKESEAAQRRLNERSKECIDILKKLKEDSKKMTNIGNFWKKQEENVIRENKINSTTNIPRATSAPQLKKQKENAERKKRPKTSQAAHVLKFEKIESLVPDADAFQVHCHKIRSPISKKYFASNARDLVPRNLNMFEDAADWCDVLKATDWLDENSKRGHERRLDIKSPLVLAKFATQRDDNVFASDIESKKFDVFTDKNTEVLTNMGVQLNESSLEMSNIEKRMRWSSALKQIKRMSTAVGNFSRSSAINLEHMQRTHEREMRNSGLRSALESTSQLQQAKALQHISGLEPLSDRDLKQKILSAQNALQKDIDAAKLARRKYTERNLSKFPEKQEVVEPVSVCKSVIQERGRISVASSEPDSEDFDIFKSTVLPNLRINDEMEKRVASYLENITPKTKNKKESTARKSESSVPINTDDIKTELFDKQFDAQRDDFHEVSLERYKEERCYQQAKRLIKVDNDRRARVASTTTRSLMLLLRGTQHKLEKVRQCCNDLNSSIKRIDKKRPPPPRIVYTLNDVRP